jgi:hypothetical protein
MDDRNWASVSLIHRQGKGKAGRSAILAERYALDPARIGQAVEATRNPFKCNSVHLRFSLFHPGGCKTRP